MWIFLRVLYQIGPVLLFLNSCFDIIQKPVPSGQTISETLWIAVEKPFSSQ
jgi:hypothetical protein